MKSILTFGLDVGNTTKKEKKSWVVTYGKAVEKQPTINQQFDIGKTKEELKNILERITEFAFKETSETWGNIFEKAKKTLESKEPEKDFYHNDLIFKENHKLKNRQLLMSASKAFVFGGMGSWNDMWLEPKEVEEKYNLLSAELYETMMKAIRSAILIIICAFIILKNEVKFIHIILFTSGLLFFCINLYK